MAHRMIYNENFSNCSKVILIEHPRYTTLAQFYTVGHQKCCLHCYVRKTLSLTAVCAQKMYFGSPRSAVILTFTSSHPLHHFSRQWVKFWLLLKSLRRTPSDWKQEWSQNFILYKINFSNFGWYLLLLSGITTFDYVQSITSCSF